MANVIWYMGDDPLPRIHYYDRHTITRHPGISLRPRRKPHICPDIKHLTTFDRVLSYFTGYLRSKLLRS